MEAVIKDQLLEFMLTKNLISRYQHGFMLNHSTTTNRLECTHDWVDGLTNHTNIDVVYIDFSKAFDSIVFFLKISGQIGPVWQIWPLDEMNIKFFKG
jgi:hypothetical protein